MLICRQERFLDKSYRRKGEIRRAISARAGALGLLLSSATLHSQPVMVPTRKPAANRTRRLLLHEESPIVAAVRTNELVKCGTARQPQNRMCGTPPPMR